MFFLPFSFLIFILLILLLPALFVLLQIGVIGIAFQKLGMTPATGFMFFLFSLIGSAINIPIHEKSYNVPTEIPIPEFYQFWFGIKPKILEKQVIAVNLGGCILPVLLSLYLLFRAPFFAVLIGTIIMTVVSKILSRPVPGIGIAMPAFIPPILSAILALILARENAPAVAYISGVLGVLIGADLLNLSKLTKVGHGVMSIGGAGVFDGIYLVGIIAVLIA
ncbi:MAG: DUF1614 domain-containing protein [candidate division WOR-3 bacterium]